MRKILARTHSMSEYQALKAQLRRLHRQRAEIREQAKKAPDSQKQYWALRMRLIKKDIDRILGVLQNPYALEKDT